MPKTLVTVHFTVGNGAYNAGMIAGFEPKMAQHLVETVKCAVYTKEQPSEEAASFVTGRQAPAPEAVEPEKDPGAVEVSLPEDVDLSIEVPGEWEAAHHKTRIGLASKIMKAAVDTDDKARAVIAAFLTLKETSK